MICRKWWVVPLAWPVFAVAEPDAGSADRYLDMLRQRPESQVLLGRTIDAWLAEGDLEGLGAMLENRAAAGGADDWRVLAAFHRFQGDDEAAVAALDEAVSLAPDDAPTRLARAKALGEMRRFGPALEDLSLAAHDDALAVEAGTLRGRFLARAGRPDEAVHVWQALADAHPQDEGLREDLVELQLGEGMTDAAIATARQLAASTTDPYRRALRQLRLGELLANAARREDAEATFREVLAASAEDSWLEREVLAQATALFPRHRDPQAWRAFLESLRQDHPQRVALKKELAHCLLAGGSADEGLELFREVLRVLPGNRDAREEFIAMLEKAGRFEDAVAETESLLAIARNDVALWERLAVFRRHLDDAKGVRAAVDQALDLMPGDESGAVGRARLLERFEWHKEAEDVLRKAVAAHGATGEAGAALPVFLTTHDRRDEALELWRQMAAEADRDGVFRVAAALGAHGLGGEAFGIVESRLADFPDDDAFLELVCDMGQWWPDPEAVLPHALRRLAGLSDPWKSEAALRQVVSLIARSGGRDRWLNELAAKKDPSSGDLCLLAELHESQGDRAAADAALEQAAIREPVIVAVQRARLLESRGEWQAAAAEMLRLCELPAGKTPENARRLVDLLVRADDPEAALAASERWRNLAPSDPRLAMKRADIFLRSGRAAEGVAELRRASARFGGTEVRAKLAEAQLSAGMQDEARRGFLALHDEATEPVARQRWARAVAGTATTPAERETLVAEFRRRARADTSAVEPLLTLAEFHGHWNDRLGRRDCLAEASRRAPDDDSLKLLHAMAEEDAGDPEAAAVLLRGMLGGERAAAARQRLAILWMRQGDVARALQETAAAGDGGDPRAAENLAMQLFAADERELATEELARAVSRHPGDWRLGYLHAVALAETGRSEEAFQRFVQLLHAQGDLDGLTPRPPGEWPQLAEAAAPEHARRAMPLFRAFAAVAANLQPQRMASPSGRGSVSVVHYLVRPILPETPDEARRIALARAIQLAGAGGAEAEAMLRAIESPHYDDLDVLKRVVPLEFPALSRLLHSDEATPAMFRWLIDGGFFQQADEGLLRRAIQRLARFDPTLAFVFASRWLEIVSRPDVATAELLLDLFPAVPGARQPEAGGVLLRLALAGDCLPTDVRERAWKMLEDAILHSPESMAAHRQNAVGWFVGLIRARNFEEAMAWLGRLDLERLRTPEPKQIAQPITGGQQRATGPPQGPPEFPAILDELIPYPYRSLERDWTKDAPPISEDHEVLLEALGETASAGQRAIDLVAAAEAAAELENPVLRIGFHAALDRSVDLEREVSAIEADGNAGLEPLLVAAAYRASIDDNWEAASALLLRAAASDAEGEWRARIDRGLLEAGRILAAAGVENATVAEARLAVSRLAARPDLPDRKESLAVAMRELGMNDEADAVEARPEPSRTVRYHQTHGMLIYPPSRGWATGSGGVTAEIDAIRELVASGQREVAVKRLVPLLRRNGVASAAGKIILERVRSLEIEDELIEASAARTTTGYQARREHALLLHRLGRAEAALPLLAELMALRPDDVGVTTDFLMHAPKHLLRSEMAKLARPDFDARLLDAVFQGWIAGGSRPGAAGAFGALADFALELDPSHEPARNLTWLNFQARMLAETVDPTKSRGRRNPDARRLFLAMLRHPQTAEQGFRLMFFTRQFQDAAELDNTARKAAERGIRVRFDGSAGQISDPDVLLWARHLENSTGSHPLPPVGVSSDAYIAGRPHIEVFGETFAAELAAADDAGSRRIAECLGIVAAPGTEALDAWMERELPAADRAGDLLWLHRLAAGRQRTDLLAPLETRACQLLGTENANVPPLHAVLARALARDARRETILRMTTEILGPAELWPHYSRIALHPLEPILIRRIDGFRTLAAASRSSSRAVAAMARFAALHDLASLAPLDIDALMPAGADAEWLLASGIFASGPELAAPNALDGYLPISSRLVGRLKSSGIEPRELGRRLLETEGDERFWARLVGSALIHDVTPAVAELDREAETIATWPDHCRQGLADFILAHLSEAQGQVGPLLQALLQERLDQQAKEPPDLLWPPDLNDSPPFSPELPGR